MAVLPFPRSTTFDDDTPGPQTGTGNTRIEIDEDGLVNLEIPGSKPAASRRPKREPASNSADFDRNLAEDIDPSALSALASYLIEGIEADEAERSEWEETVNLTAKYLGIKLSDPVAEVSSDGTVCQVVATCMLEAAMKLWGTSYAEMLPADGPVKVKREDPIQPPPMPTGGITPLADDAEPGQEPQNQTDEAGDDLAEALEEDLNWYLTTKDRGYYPDFSKMLMSRNLIGSGFREVYRCPIKRMPISRWIMSQDLIVQGDPADVNESNGRVTARKKVAQSVMRRMMMSGEYLDTPLVAPTGMTTPTEIVIGMTEGTTPTPTLPRDFEHTVYECSCELGSGTGHDLYGSLEVLDTDETGEDVGYPLPYRVALDHDSRTVLSIKRNWKKGDTDHRRKRRWVKYGFIPAFGFYDWGLIHLVGNPTLAATMLQRSAVDTTLFSNFPGWIMAKGSGSRPEDTVFRPLPGQVKTVPLTGNTKLTDVVMPWPYKEPSAQSMALDQKLEADVKKLAGVIEIPVGEGRIGNTPVGTIMSYIESVSVVPGAVHKADHTAQAEEFELLRELIAEEPEVLWRGNKSPARKWQAADEVLSPDLSPRADPNTPSQIHRLLKIQGLIMMGGLPQFAMDAEGPIANNRAIFKRAAEIMVGTSADEFTHAPQPPQQAPPPPDPRVQAAQINASAKQQQGEQKLQSDKMDNDARMQELAVQSSDKAADREATNEREAMKIGATRTKVGADMATAAVGHAQDQASQATEHQHQTGMQQADHTQQIAAPLLAPPDKDSTE